MNSASLLNLARLSWPDVYNLEFSDERNLHTEHFAPHAHLVGVFVSIRPDSTRHIHLWEAVEGKPNAGWSR